MIKLLTIFTIFFIFLFADDIQPGDSSTSSNKTIGYLIDSAINGVQYKCTDSASSIEGITGDQGEDGSFQFAYGTGNCGKIKFYLGNITLATLDVTKINDDRKVYVTDMVGKDRNDTNNTAVLHIIRLLQTFDEDLKPTNGLDINKSIRDNLSLDTTPTIDLNSNPSNISDNDLKDILKYAKVDRTLIDPIKALVYLELKLRKAQIEVDTVPPFKVYITSPVIATANNKTYIELNGERYTTIYLNGINTQLEMDENDKFMEFELDTSMLSNTFREFNITTKDKLNRESEALSFKIFKDTDQPVFNNFPTSVTMNKGAVNVLDLNISDFSLDYNLTLHYDIEGTTKDLFDINATTGNLHFKQDAQEGNYSITIKVMDQAEHYNIEPLNIIVR